MATPTSRLPYYPALDGLRGLSVAAVLAFHAGFSWAVGGYLGVSTFFTLSGFLITSLLLREQSGTGGIDLREFWRRRFRRLLPAALVTLAVVVLFGATVAGPGQLRDLRVDVLAALGYVANWRFVLAGESYADLFTAPSPVLHFWSLAIEEQFYVLYPLLVVGLLRVSSGRRQVVAAGLGALAMLSPVLAMATSWSVDRIYYGTDTRVGELAVGALLALALDGRRLARPARSAAALGGVAALVTIGLLVATTEQQSAWLYDGGLTAYALLSAVVILAATQVRGLVPVALGFRPLVALGRISYGVYLYHWPLYLWLTPDRTGLGQWPLFGLRATLALSLAAASYHLVEQPVRRGRALRGRRFLVGAPAAAVAVAVAAVAVTVDPPEPPVDFAAAQQQLEALGVAAPRDASLTVGAGLEPPAAPPPRLAVFGDSTALMTAVGLGTWASETGDAVNAGGSSWLGCGVGRGGERRTTLGEEPTPDGCDDWAVTWAAATEAGDPDIAIVQVGPWEVTDRRLEGEDEWRHLGDPVYDDFLKAEMLAATDLLASSGAEVVWLTSPAIGPGVAGDEHLKRGEAADPARMARLNELIAELEVERPGTAHVIDLAGYLAGTGDDVRLRPDGVHFSDLTSREVAYDFLGPELVAIQDTEWLPRYLTTADPALPETLRVLAVGDATAVLLAVGLTDYASTNEGLALMSIAELDCGVSRGGRRDYHGAEADVPGRCDDWPTGWADALTQFTPDVVVMLTGPFEVADRRLEGRDWTSIGNPGFDGYLAAEMAAAAEVLTSTDAVLVWLSSPLIDVGRDDISPPPQPYPESDPARMARLNELISDLAAADPDVVLADYAGHLAGYPGGELDADMRPDGVHLANDRTRLVADWLVPEVERLYVAWVEERWLAGRRG